MKEQENLDVLGRSLYAITDNSVPAYIYRNYMETGTKEAKFLRYGYMFALKYTGNMDARTFLMYDVNTRQFTTITNPPLSPDAQSMEVSSDRYVLMYFAPARGMFYEDIPLTMPMGMPCVKFTLYTSSGLVLCNGKDYSIISPWSGLVKKSFQSEVSPGCCSETQATPCPSGTFSVDFNTMIGDTTSTSGGFCITTVKRRVTAEPFTTVTGTAVRVAKLSNGTLTAMLENMTSDNGGVSFWIRLMSSTVDTSIAIYQLGITWGIRLVATKIKAGQYMLGAQIIHPATGIHYISQLVNLDRWTHISFLYNVRRSNSKPSVFNFTVNGNECDTVLISTTSQMSWNTNNLSTVTIGPFTGETSNWIFWNEDLPPINVLKQMFQYNDSMHNAAVEYGLYYFPFYNDYYNFRRNLQMTSSDVAFMSSTAKRNFYHRNPLRPQKHTMMGKLLGHLGWDKLVMHRKGSAFVSAPCVEIGQACLSSTPPTPASQTCSTGNDPRIFEKCTANDDATGKFCQQGNPVPLSSCNSENGAVHVSYIDGNIAISSSSPTRVEYEFDLDGGVYYNAWIKFSTAVASENVYCYMYNTATDKITQGFSVTWDVAWTQPPPTTTNKQSYNGLSGVSTTYNNNAYWVQLGTSNGGYIKCKSTGKHRLVIASALYKGTFEGGLSGSASAETYRSLCSNTSVSSSTSSSTSLVTPLTREGIPFIYDIVISEREYAQNYVNIDPIQKMFLESAQYGMDANARLSISKLPLYQLTNTQKERITMEMEDMQRAANIINAVPSSNTSSASSTTTYFSQTSPPNNFQRMRVLPRGLVSGGTTSTVGTSAECINSCLGELSCKGVSTYSTFLPEGTKELKCVKYTSLPATKPCTGPCITPVTLAKVADTGVLALPGGGHATQACSAVANSRTSSVGTTAPPTWTHNNISFPVTVVSTPSSVYTGLLSSQYTDNGSSLGTFNNIDHLKAAQKCDSISNCSYFKCYMTLPSDGKWTPIGGFYSKDNWNLVFSNGRSITNSSVGDGIRECGKSGMCEGFTFNKTTNEIIVGGEITSEITSQSQSPNNNIVSYIKAPTNAVSRCELFSGHTVLDGNPNCACSFCSYKGHVRVCDLGSGKICNGQTGKRLCNEMTYQRMGYLNTQFSSIPGLTSLTVTTTDAKADAARLMCSSLPLALENTSVDQSGFPTTALNSDSVRNISSPYEAIHEFALMFRLGGSRGSTIQVKEYDLDWPESTSSWENLSTKYSALSTPYVKNLTFGSGIRLTYTPVMVETCCCLRDIRGNYTDKLLLVIDYNVDIGILKNFINGTTVSVINTEGVQESLYDLLGIEPSYKSKGELITRLDHMGPIGMVVVYNTLTNTIPERNFYSPTYLFWKWNTSNLCISYYCETQPTIAIVFNNDNGEHVYVDTSVLENKPPNQYEAFMDGPYSTSGMNALIQQWPIKSRSEVYLRTRDSYTGSVSRDDQTYTMNNPGTNFMSGTVFKVQSSKNLPFISWSSIISLYDGEEYLSMSSSNTISPLPGERFTWQIQIPNGQFPPTLPPLPPSITYVDLAQKYNLDCNLSSQSEETSVYKSISCPRLNMVLQSNEESLGGKFTIVKGKSLVTSSTKGRIDISKTASLQKKTSSKVEQSIQVKTVAMVKLRLIQEFAKSSPGLLMFFNMTTKYWYFIPGVFVILAIFVVLSIKHAV